MDKVGQEMLVEELHVFDLFEIVFVFLKQLVHRLLFSCGAIGLVGSSSSLRDMFGVHIARFRFFVLVESDYIVAYYSR